MPGEKELTKYQQEQLEPKQKEFPCGLTHNSIEEAIVHAEQNLGMRDANGKHLVKLEPYLGTMRFTSGSVVGWQTNPQKRYRLDYDPDFELHNREALEMKTGVNKGTQGIHVNEEDFTRMERQKICHATTSSFLIADHYWRKWSSEFGRRGLITPEDVERWRKR